MSRDFGAPSKPEPELAIAREAAQFLLPAPAPKGDNSGARDCLAESRARWADHSGGGLCMNDNRSEAEKAAIRAEVERVRLEHHDLEAAIEALLAVGAVDQLQIQRLKKRKLLLRDRLQHLEDEITPDIIA